MFAIIKGIVLEGQWQDTSYSSTARQRLSQWADDASTALQGSQGVLDIALENIDSFCKQQMIEVIK